MHFSPLRRDSLYRTLSIGRWWICHQLRTPRRILRKETALPAPSCGLLPLQTLNLSRSDLEAFPLIDRSSIADSGVWFPWFSKLGFFKAVYYLTHRGFLSAFHTHTLFNAKFESALYHFCFALTFLRACVLVLLYSAPLLEVSGAQGRYILKLVCTSYALLMHTARLRWTLILLLCTGLFENISFCFVYLIDPQ